jgi:hypothetical protein
LRNKISNQFMRHDREEKINTTQPAPALESLPALSPSVPLQREMSSILIDGDKRHTGDSGYASIELERVSRTPTENFRWNANTFFWSSLPFPSALFNLPKIKSFEFVVLISFSTIHSALQLILLVPFKKKKICSLWSEEFHGAQNYTLRSRILVFVFYDVLFSRPGERHWRFRLLMTWWIGIRVILTSGSPFGA